MGSCDIIVNDFWSAKMRLYFLGIMVTMGGQVSAQRRQFIQDLITRLKNSPGPQSSSPCWSSDRQFEVIAPGHLPLQNHKIQDEFEGELLEGKYVPDLPSSRIQENSDNRDNRRKTLPGQYSRNVGQMGHVAIIIFRKQTFKEISIQEHKNKNWK